MWFVDDYALSLSLSLSLSLFRRGCTHTGVKSSRCLCVVFINASTSTVQFLEMK